MENDQEIFLSEQKKVVGHYTAYDPWCVCVCAYVGKV